MNRDEMLKRTDRWLDWPIAPLKGMPKEPGGWAWVVVDGMCVLTHSVHDPITIADWSERGRCTPANPTPAVATRDEALQHVAKWSCWPVNSQIKPCPPEEWEWIDDKVGATGKALFNPSYGMITVNDWQDARNGVVASTPAPNKYQRTVPSTTIDVYDVLHAYSVTNPATQHAVKKLLQPGNRGHKDTLTDLREALASIQRAIQIEEAAQ